MPVLLRWLLAACTAPLAPSATPRVAGGGRGAYRAPQHIIMQCQQQKEEEGSASRTAVSAGGTPSLRVAQPKTGFTPLKAAAVPSSRSDLDLPPTHVVPPFPPLSASSAPSSVVMARVAPTMHGHGQLGQVLVSWPGPPGWRWRTTAEATSAANALAEALVELLVHLNGNDGNITNLQGDGDKEKEAGMLREDTLCLAMGSTAAIVEAFVVASGDVLEAVAARSGVGGGGRGGRPKHSPNRPSLSSSPPSSSMIDSRTLRRLFEAASLALRALVMQRPPSSPSIGKSDRIVALVASLLRVAARYLLVFGELPQDAHSWSHHPPIATAASSTPHTVVSAAAAAATGAGSSAAAAAAATTVVFQYGANPHSENGRAVVVGGISSAAGSSGANSPTKGNGHHHTPRGGKGYHQPPTAVSSSSSELVSRSFLPPTGSLPLSSAPPSSLSSQPPQLSSTRPALVEGGGGCSDGSARPGVAAASEGADESEESDWDAESDKSSDWDEDDGNGVAGPPEGSDSDGINGAAFGFIGGSGGGSCSSGNRSGGRGDIDGRAMTWTPWALHHSKGWAATLTVGAFIRDASLLLACTPTIAISAPFDAVVNSLPFPERGVVWWIHDHTESQAIA